MLLLGAGLAYGGFQLFRGFASLENIPQGSRAWNDWTRGLTYATDNETHIGKCLLAPGYGLEEFIVWERREKAIKAAAEAEAKALEDAKSSD